MQFHGMPTGHALQDDEKQYIQNVKKRVAKQNMLTSDKTRIMQIHKLIQNFKNCTNQIMQPKIHHLVMQRVDQKTTK